MTHQWQAHTEHSALTGHARHLNSTCITFDDRFADGKTESRAALAVSTMAKKRIKNVVDHPGWNPQSGVTHLDHRRLAFGMGPDRQASSVRHRMMRILYQVEHDHAQVAVVGQNAQVARSQVLMLDDTVALGVEIEQLQRVVHCLVERYDLRLLLRQAGKQQESLGDTGAPIDFCIHHFQIAANALLINIAMTNVAQQTLDGKAHGTQRIVYFVSNTGSQQPEFRQSLFLRQARDFRQITGRFNDQPFGDRRNKSDNVDDQQWIRLLHK